jgi:hypothetical protein
MRTFLSKEVANGQFLVKALSLPFIGKDGEGNGEERKGRNQGLRAIGQLSPARDCDMEIQGNREI